LQKRGLQERGLQERGKQERGKQKRGLQDRGKQKRGLQPGDPGAQAGLQRGRQLGKQGVPVGGQPMIVCRSSSKSLQSSSHSVISGLSHLGRLSFSSAI
jgi:hypothetical protein